MSLVPVLRDECASIIRSVTWSVADAAIASFTPRAGAPLEMWVTGRAAGSTTIVASIVFADGRSQQPTRATVVAPASASGTVVLEGEVELEGYRASAPVPGSDFRRFIPFTLPRDASQVDGAVDWVSLENTGDIALFSGSCAGDFPAACPGLTFVASPRDSYVRPLPFTATNLSAGPYTLRVDLLGSGREVVRYEVRMTPR